MRVLRREDCGHGDQVCEATEGAEFGAAVAKGDAGGWGARRGPAVRRGHCMVFTSRADEAARFVHCLEAVVFQHWYYYQRQSQCWLQCKISVSEFDW